MVELVDTCDSNSHAAKRNGSSPFIPTIDNIKIMKRILIYLSIFISLGAFPYACEDEYIEGIGWKKIVYQDSGPVESLGRCASEDEQAASIILLGLIFWGAYEYFEDEPKALIETKNLQIIPLDGIYLNTGSNKSVDITLFKYSF